jgi:hypothetical protein
MMKAGKAGCSKQPDEDANDDTGEDDKADDNDVLDQILGARN